MVPTVDREVGAPRRCCNATAGGSPVISCTCGAPTCCSSRRAYGATDSKYRRCASAYNVPKASDDFPDPDTPVNTTIASRGTSTSTLRRLCSLAPRTRTKWSIGSVVTRPPYPDGRRSGEVVAECREQAAAAFLPVRPVGPELVEEDPVLDVGEPGALVDRL